MAFVCAVLLGLLDCRSFVRTLGKASAMYQSYSILAHWEI